MKACRQVQSQITNHNIIPEANIPTTDFKNNDFEEEDPTSSTDNETFKDGQDITYKPSLRYSRSIDKQTKENNKTTRTAYLHDGGKY